MKIGIVPIRLENKKLLDDIISGTGRDMKSEFYIKNFSIEISKFFSKERRQYYSTEILSEVINMNTENENLIVITEVDLYVPVLTFVFGEAQLNGSHSIVSICRLHNEFYGMKRDYNILLRRTKKEVLHELGHNLGLIHCLDWDCVMHSSNRIEEVDIKGDFFCSDCYNEIKNKL